MPPKPQADERCHGEEQKSIEGEKLLSIWASTKSGDSLLAPAPKFEEQASLLSKERRLVQVCVELITVDLITKILQTFFL